MHLLISVLPANSIFHIRYQSLPRHDMMGPQKHKWKILVKGKGYGRKFKPVYKRWQIFQNIFTQDEETYDRQGTAFGDFFLMQKG